MTSNRLETKSRKIHRLGLNTCSPYMGIKEVSVWIGDYGQKSMRVIKSEGIEELIRGILDNINHEIKVKYHTYKVKKQVASMESEPWVGGPTNLSENTKLGKNTHFNGMTIWGEGEVTIGDNFHSGSGCKIRTMTHNYHGEALPYDNEWIIEDVEIGDNVWIGQDVIILPGNTIGEGAIIQAGSVVVSDIPKCAIAGGHPAEVFGYRDKAHYNRLKEEEKFN